jgi:hypothetical protein
MIQKRIDSLKPYFKGIKVAENYKIVEFNLKKSWVIPENNNIDVQQKTIKENSNILYNMFYTDVKSFDQLLDYVEDEVINYNLEIEQKEELLRMKVEELKRVFEDKGLDELNSLKFTTEDDSLKLNSNKSNSKKADNLDNIELEKNKNGVTEEFSTNS